MQQKHRIRFLIEWDNGSGDVNEQVCETLNDAERYATQVWKSLRDDPEMQKKIKVFILQQKKELKLTERMSIHLETIE